MFVKFKAESGKKRANADAKTPESKKAKLVTPQKTGDISIFGLQHCVVLTC